jgi:leucyl aminopeptidase
VRVPDRPRAVAFFDIGDTLAAVRVTPAGTGIEEIVVLPGVPDALEALRSAGIPMGVVSNPGPVPTAEVDAALERAGLADLLDPALRVYGRKDSVRIFEQAARAARAAAPGPPPRLLFVGEDATERWFAGAADFEVCPHPSLAPGLLLGAAALHYLRIRVPPSAAGSDWRAVLRGRPVVPLHLAADPAELYAVADTATALELDDLGFWVDRLGADGEPLTSDLYLLRDDARAEAAFGAPAGAAAALFDDEPGRRRVLASTAEGLLVAVPAGRSVESYHLASGHHGHNLKLTPVPSVLEAAAVDGLRAVTGPPGRVGRTPASDRAASDLARAGLGWPDLAGPELTAAETRAVRREVTVARVRRDVARYSGGRALTGRTSLRSRHIHHPDNARAIEALTADLAALGGGRMAVRSHRFTHEGLGFDNVEAVLAGSGLPGTVLVTAHLDSTAARAPGYLAPLDPAPGADDDASGVAGVLAAARAVLALDSAVAVPRREFRFVLFNAEEHGLVGSRAYAREQVALGTGVVAVLQLDMVGFDAVAERTFELHAGFTPSPAVQKRSLALAELVAAQVSRVAPGLPAPQLYPGDDGTPDPAERRSDHYSFQLQGYPACLASEDFFAGPTSTSPAPDPNPNYHLPSDTAVDAGYACDITRAVTAAAWICGTR